MVNAGHLAQRNNQKLDQKTRGMTTDLDLNLNTRNYILLKELLYLENWLGGALVVEYYSLSNLDKSSLNVNAYNIQNQPRRKVS